MRLFFSGILPTWHVLCFRRTLPHVTCSFITFSTSRFSNCSPFNSILFSRRWNSYIGILESWHVMFSVGSLRASNQPTMNLCDPECFGRNWYSRVTSCVRFQTNRRDIVGWATCVPHSLSVSAVTPRFRSRHTTWLNQPGNSFPVSKSWASAPRTNLAIVRIVSSHVIRATFFYCGNGPTTLDKNCVKFPALSLLHWNALRHPPVDEAEFLVSFKSVLNGQYVRLVDIWIRFVVPVSG